MKTEAKPNKTMSPAKSNFTVNLPHADVFREKNPYPQVNPMSRHLHAFCASSRFVRIARLALLVAVLLAPAMARAGVIWVDVDSYRLDGGKAVTGPWEIAERIAVAGDVAIIVMDEKSSQTTIQTMLQLLATLKVPTLLTKKNDYKALVERGVIKPTTTP
jgi:hypothetical protein